jgi:hypothetical protein
MAVALLGCSPTPSPFPTGPTTPAPTPLASPSPSSDSGAELVVDLGGTIGCGMFPYSCRAVLSVVPAGTEVEAVWRPPDTDPWWAPDGPSSEGFDPKPVGGIPTLAPGGNRLIISLLGSYDTPSYDPDGSIATDLLSRCSIDIDLDPAAGPVEVQVTFTPDGLSFGGSCTIEQTR